MTLRATAARTPQGQGHAALGERGRRGEGRIPPLRHAHEERGGEADDAEEEEEAAEKDFVDKLNPDSLVTLHGFVEPALAFRRGERFQFMREGYFLHGSGQHKERPGLSTARSV